MGKQFQNQHCYVYSFLQMVKATVSTGYTSILQSLLRVLYAQFMLKLQHVSQNTMNIGEVYVSPVVDTSYITDNYPPFSCRTVSTSISLLMGKKSGALLNLIGILTMICPFSRDPNLTLAITGLISLSKVSSSTSQPNTSENGFVTHETQIISLIYHLPVWALQMCSLEHFMWQHY